MMQVFHTFTIVMYAIAIPCHILLIVALIRGYLKYKKESKNENGGESHHDKS